MSIPLMKAGLSSLPGLGGIGGLGGAGNATQAAGGAFGDVLKNMVQSTMTAQNQAQDLSVQAASGADVPMHQVVQALSKAELSLQTLITVRDRAVEAYQQIQQMPI